jgi:hypothetical protein
VLLIITHALQILDRHLALKIEYLAQRRLEKILARNDACLSVMFRCMAGVVRGSEEGPAKFTTHAGIVSASYQKSKKIILPPRSSRQKRAVLRDLTSMTRAKLH